jgi:hypothetical protein
MFLERDGSFLVHPVKGFQEFEAEESKKKAVKESFTQQLDGQLNELNQLIDRDGSKLQSFLRF